WLATATDEIRVEYAQNYRNNTLLHKLNVYGYEDYSREWYNIDGIPFTNGGAIMGHHMGSEADDIYFEFQHHWKTADLKLFYHAERHGIVATDPWPPHEREFPEKLYQYGIEVSKVWKDLSVEALFLWNQYKNIDVNPDPIFIDPSAHYDANSYVFGLTFKYRVGSN
ncbi:MAG: hypothetical protein HY089_03450, partial [Ignavibacteriales bacterium]|nr:hypothetical protein [Ignavibacteriales bacterium]